MRYDQQANLLLALMLAISAFGLVTVSALALFSSRAQSSNPWRKPLVGSMFASICLGGIAAVFFPRKCVETLSLPRDRVHAESDIQKPASVTLKGHHPACSRFSAHTIRIRDSCHCAACTGLLIGAIVALTGTLAFFFADWSFIQSGFLSVSVSIAGIGLGFLQFKFKTFVRLTMNSFFVIGAFLILASVDFLTQNLPIDLYALFLIVFWLLTRILISKWNNSRLCLSCESCEFGKRS
jgi:hypothetical protein